MKQEDGSWRCGPCIYEDSKRKIRVLRKDDHEVKGMITEKQKEVDTWNNSARRHIELFNLPENKSLRLRRIHI
jgi:hypothetical protein